MRDTRAGRGHGDRFTGITVIQRDVGRRKRGCDRLQPGVRDRAVAGDVDASTRLVRIAQRQIGKRGPTLQCQRIARRSVRLAVVFDWQREVAVREINRQRIITRRRIDHDLRAADRREGNPDRGRPVAGRRPDARDRNRLRVRDHEFGRAGIGLNHDLIVLPALFGDHQVVRTIQRNIQALDRRALRGRIIPRARIHLVERTQRGRVADHVRSRNRVGARREHHRQRRRTAGRQRGDRPIAVNGSRRVHRERSGVRCAVHVDRAQVRSA